ncbi:uncharacterized protein [Ambystoma mexicanum]|uniref:C-Answer n=1 Tax=Ambystoma mexicanum TaxID=8296 RepID=A0A3Q8S4G1_AMBME|nr:c-Answer [Ambystoma mexicanum]
MALRLLHWLCLFQALCRLHAWAGSPVLFLQNHSGPVLEGDNVTLECLTIDGDEMSGYTFQKYSKWMKTWVTLDKPNTIRCWYYEVNITRENGRLLLHIHDMQPSKVGPYRCVARDNGNSSTSHLDANATTSDNLTIPFYYISEMNIFRLNFWCGAVGSKEFVDEGYDVELRCRVETESSQQAIYEWSRKGDDWIIASNTLKLKEISKDQAGTYTCQARHPVLFNLVKSMSVELEVRKPAPGLSAKFWNAMPRSFPSLLALFIGIPAAVLLLIILIISLVIGRRRANNRKKPLIDEPEQRSPIYKGSQESLPSRVGDTQPLVI